MDSAAPRPGSVVGFRATALSGRAPDANEAVAVFPFIHENPYQELLYGELATHGIDAVADADFKLRRLLRQRGRVSALHFHWPQNYYTWWRQPARLRMALSWFKIALFGIRLALARALGFTIIWTIHEVFPHERSPRGVDRAGGRLLARASHLLIAHDRGTAARAMAELRADPALIEVVPHASYIGVYPAGRPREAVRAELGVSSESFTFLFFGHIRAYKGVQLLLAAFAQADLPDATLVMAGLPIDASSAEAVQGAAACDRRIKPLLEFVPDERVAELFAACDAAVLPRGDGGTSGALVLALSLGVPVVAARVPDYEEITGGEDAAWLFDVGDATSLAAALEAAARDAAAARGKGAVALEHAKALSWPEVGTRTATLFGSAIASVRQDHREAQWDAS
jgi:beta-1,4-mannosyltransferase